MPGIGGSDVVPNVAGAPDLLLYNGKISTVDQDNTEVQAIAIRNGDIIATGSDARDPARWPSSTPRSSISRAGACCRA